MSRLLVQKLLHHITTSPQFVWGEPRPCVYLCQSIAKPRTMFGSDTVFVNNILANIFPLMHHHIKTSAHDTLCVESVRLHCQLARTIQSIMLLQVQVSISFQDPCTQCLNQNGANIACSLLTTLKNWAASSCGCGWKFNVWYLETNNCGRVWSEQDEDLKYT